MSLSAHGAAQWWRDMRPDPDRGRPGDRGGLARLRRCATVGEAMREPATHDLFRRAEGTGHWDLASAALAAAVLAHIRDDDRENRHIARRIGPDDPGKPETALLKPLRFRRLMEAASEDERLTAFRRLAALAGGKLNVENLAEALLHWTEDRQRRWVYDYWNADVRPPNTHRAEETTP